MDNFEQGTLPQKQKDMVHAQCWECGEHKMCNEYIACCVGTRLHSCNECEERIRSANNNSPVL